MKPAKPAAVRFYFDADVLGLAKVLAPLRADITYPGDPGATVHKKQRPPCPIAPRTKDPDWIPLVAARGWLIVTRDARIQQKTAEIEAVRSHGAKMVNLAGPDAASVWGQLELLMSRWRDIETLIESPGPFIHIASRTGRLRPISLESRSQ